MEKYLEFQQTDAEKYQVCQSSVAKSRNFTKDLQKNSHGHGKMLILSNKYGKNNFVKEYQRKCEFCQKMAEKSKFYQRLHKKSNFIKTSCKNCNY